MGNSHHGERTAVITWQLAAKPSIVVARQRLSESRDVERFEVMCEVILGEAGYLHGGRPLPMEIGLGPVIRGGRVTGERKECCSRGPS
ncbi:hypothetical protein [Halococcus sp. AFM35]|uniref:hypothetical protein n=1 Tax=Halococcus sp. AFM35 TaxID=3421653 RepID=UPI003EBE59A5